MTAPVPAAPRFDRPFKVAVDASDTGVGAALLQDGSDGVEHPVSCFSRKLDRHQKWYSTIEKETLALVMAFEHFEVYVSSSSVPVVVYTDHNPLFLQRMRNKKQALDELEFKAAVLQCERQARPWQGHIVAPVTPL